MVIFSDSSFMYASMSGSLVSASMASAGMRPSESNLGANTGSSSMSFLESRVPNVVSILLVWLKWLI